MEIGTLGVCGDFGFIELKMEVSLDAREKT